MLTKERILTHSVKFFMAAFIIVIIIICAFGKQDNSYNTSKHDILNEYRESIKQKNNLINGKKECDVCVVDVR